MIFSFTQNLSFRKIFSIGLSYRIFVYLILVSIPLFHEKFGNISPLSFHSFADMKFYLLFGNCGEFNFSEFLITYKNVLQLNFDDVICRYPGPIFSLIINILNYSENFTILVSLLTFSIEIISYYLWSKYLFFKINKVSALVFSFMPLPLIFGFLHSPDIIFYLLSSLIILFLKDFIKLNNINFFILCFLMVLTRPSSFLILFFILIYGIIKNSRMLIIISSICIIFCIFYYLPYFIDELRIVKKNTQIYYTVNNVFLNHIFIYIQKFCYLMGFSPSESGNKFFLTIRYVCGLIFIIGYLYSYRKFKLFNFLLINIHIISIVLFMYPAYRYILPIMPILFLYSYKLTENILIKYKLT